MVEFTIPVCRRCRLPVFETYMVTDEVWELAGEAPGRLNVHLHLACLQINIGRAVTDDDLTQAQCNEPLRLMFRNGSVVGGRLAAN